MWNERATGEGQSEVTWTCGMKGLRVKACSKAGTLGRTCWLLGMGPREIQDGHRVVKTNPASGT